MSRIAFPLGGIGAGMVCLEGAGSLSHVSLKGHPAMGHEPLMFSAVSFPGGARVLEGPVPDWKLFLPGAGNGSPSKSYGLPRFAQSRFSARFPFATVLLEDPKVPLSVEVTGWSPFTPPDADASSLPVAALEYRFTNRAGAPLEGIYSFHAANFLPKEAKEGSVRSAGDGFLLSSPDAAFAAQAEGAQVDAAWFRGGWFDPLTLVWKKVKEGAATRAGPVTEGDPSPGGSLFVPFRLGKGESRTIRLRLAWFVPQTDLKAGKDAPGCCAPGESCATPAHRPWYAGAFAGIESLAEHWRENYDGLREASHRFSACLFDSTLPPEVMDAVTANLSILKTPTVQRQPDGKLWCWEGCSDQAGCCEGSCTHVWNYAQALPHLFPALERTLRQTEFGECQDARGHQTFRSALPIRPVAHEFHAAADGQLGGVLKVHRDWRISGNTPWMKDLWPKVRQSMDYCIETWDPAHKGLLEKPHHNTYDIEFWGPDGMCGSFYLGALKAASLMAKAAGDADSARRYSELLAKGRAETETELWNGEYFIQKIVWEDFSEDVRTFQPKYSPEARALLQKEGPKYQYGAGCLSDGVIGAWMAEVCAVGEILDPGKVESHLKAVHAHNLKRDLSEHANPQRPTYALGKEGGLLLCTWPRGGALTLPFVYSDEVWTGIEYQVASHLMRMGQVEKGLEIVRIARARYDGSVRNPFNEYECGHFYARALSSYALLFGLTGIRYDAVDRVLHVEPRIRGDFRSLLSTATGFGTAGVKDGKPFLEVKSGRIQVDRIAYKECP